MAEKIVVDLDFEFLGCLLYVNFCLFRNIQFGIVVLRLVQGSWPNIQLSFRAPGCWQILITFRIALFSVSTVHTSSDNVPTGVPVSYFALVERCSCGDRQEKGTYHMHLIVNVTSMIEILGGEGTLEAGHSHPECHSVHMNKVRIGLRESDFFQVGIFIHIQWNIHFNCASPS